MIVHLIEDTFILSKFLFVYILEKNFTIIKIGQVSSSVQYHSLLNIIDYSYLKYKQHDVIDDLCHRLIFKYAKLT